MSDQAESAAQKAIVFSEADTKLFTSIMRNLKGDIQVGHPCSTNSNITAWTDWLTY